MFKHFINIAWRQLNAQRLHSAINIIGLAIGISCFMLILLLARFELSFDKDYSGFENIYRVSQDILPPDGSPSMHFAGAAPQVAELLKNEFPEISAAARIRTAKIKVVQGVDVYYEEAAFADNSLFTIFKFDWLEGNSSSALSSPGTIVLTRALAEKYFPGTQAVGKFLELDSGEQLTVAGVIENLPTNTHLDIQFLISMESVTGTYGPGALENWSLSVYHSYLLLAGNQATVAQSIEQQSESFFNRYAGEGAGDYFRLVVMPMTDIHLKSGREGELSPAGDDGLVYSFILIAVFILLIACINFLNLSTVRAGQRAKEVGVKKALGVASGMIRLQLIVESIVMAFGALVIAWLLADAVLPFFNNFTQLELKLHDLAGVYTVPVLLLLALVVGALAGAYPAFYIAAFEPAPVLKGIYTRGKGAAIFRKAMVIFQFFSVVVLLIITLTAYLQLNYLRNVELGFDKDQILILGSEGGEPLGDSEQTLRNELMGNSNVLSLTSSSVVPGERISTNYFVEYEGGSDRRSMPVTTIGYEFFSTYGINILQGRGFSENFADASISSAADATASAALSRYVLNRKAARQMGWSPDEAIGKWLEVTCCGYGRGEVIGVVEDVFFESQLFPVSPLIYSLPPQGLGALTQLSLKVRASELNGTLQFIDEHWKSVFPQGLLSRRFLDEDFERLYEKEQRQATIFTLSTLLGIFVACMGLLGITWFMAEQRKKEIGIRKVLGGSSFSIVSLFVNDFLKLVSIAIILAIPTGYLIANYWLQGFANSINLGVGIFIASALIVLIIAAFTVGSVAGNAVRLMPVFSLRND